MINNILIVFGVVAILFLIAAGITSVIVYFKYKENHKHLDAYWDNTVGEFYFKFFSVGWKIKNEEKEVLTEKEFSL